MVYLLTSESLHQLEQEHKLSVLVKNQKFGCNYYFAPAIGIRLYDPKVVFSDSKNITFELNKWKTPSLFKMLQNINNVLLDKYKRVSNNIPNNVYNFFNEKDDTILIKSFLPKSKGNYLIKSISDKEEDVFTIPRRGMVYDCIILEIRNIWEQPTRSGFNLELKFTESTLKEYA